MRMYDIPAEGLPPVDSSAADGWDPSQKIVVIGSGAAGLSAAYTLEYLNVPYVILEASDTFGGRVQRDDDFLGDIGVSWDQGAEWLHTTRDASVLSELVLWDDDREDAEAFVRDEIIEYLPTGMYYYHKRKRGLRKKTWLEWTGLLEKEYKFKTKSWSRYLEKYFHSRVKDHIVYNAVVSKIDYSLPNGGARVMLQDGTEYSASKVICTVPISVLKDDITFTPELPRAKQKALQKNKMKPGLKVAIEFDERFYPEGGVFSDIGFWKSVFWLAYDYGSERGFFDALTNKGLEGKHVLSLYTYGALAEDLSKLTDEQIFEDVMGKLDRMFDGQATKHYVKHTVKNWTNVDFVRGLASDLSLGKLMVKEFAASPLVDGEAVPRVFFAGEFVGGKYGPTVHGACLTGRRAALNAIGKEYNYK